jgi:hypothetical protein
MHKNKIKKEKVYGLKCLKLTRGNIRNYFENLLLDLNEARSNEPHVDTALLFSDRIDSIQKIHKDFFGEKCHLI